MIAHPWLEVLGYQAVRLSVAFVLTVCVSLLVLMILPAGRAAVRHAAAILWLMRKRESTV